MAGQTLIAAKTHSDTTKENHLNAANKCRRWSERRDETCAQLPVISKLGLLKLDTPTMKMDFYLMASIDIDEYSLWG